MNKEELKLKISKIINTSKIIDIHTHLFAPEFKNLFLSGIDKLLTYHYLIAEFFTYEKEIKPEKFFKLTEKEQAELIWNKLFIENSPISEATRGVVTVLNKLGIEAGEKNLSKIREQLQVTDLEEYIDKVYNLTNIEYVVMTNNPFNEAERNIWLKNSHIHKKFKSALRIDDLLFDFKKVQKILKSENYDINIDLDKKSADNLKKFLSDWIMKIKPLYAMCSLPPDFKYPTKNSFTTNIIDKVLMPILKEYNLPFALMFGVKRQVNPDIKLAGDAVSRSDLNTIYNLITNYSDIKFLMTFLSRENIHETAVMARKFNNVMLFGCWWFTNVPYLIDEIVRIRLELIGLNFTPQHSDSRVFEQLIYKWAHFKNILTDILTDKYYDIIVSNWNLTDDEIRRDIENLLGKRFEEFIK